MGIKNPEQFKEWQEKAEEDLGVAKLLLKDNAYPAVICYHAHQVAEKYLKGYLAYSDIEFEKTHHLDDLLEGIAAKVDKEFQKYNEEALLLTSYYFESRYPDFREDIPIKEAEEAIEKAILIRNFVLSKVKL
jgi:HEPN domain-containing protein